MSAPNLSQAKMYKLHLKKKRPGPNQIFLKKSYNNNLQYIKDSLVHKAPPIAGLN